MDTINGLLIVGPAVRGEVGSVLDFKGGRERDREREKGGVCGELFASFARSQRAFGVIFVR